MRLLVSLILGALVFAAEPAPKARPLTPQELQSIELLNARLKAAQAEMEAVQAKYEVLQRAACDSIGVKFADCQIENGAVREKPRPIGDGKEKKNAQ